MKKVSITELTNLLTDTKFMEDIKTITVIHNNNHAMEFAVYFDDLICMTGLESEVNTTLEGCDSEDWENFQLTLRKLSDVMVFEFTDMELTNSWKQSYTDGGITEDRWDRRVIFHPFNQPNEMFCIDQIDYLQLTGEITSTPNWKKGWLNWIKSKIIGGENKCLI